QTFDEGKLRIISETAEKRIGKKGRVLIRKSGTEPVLRVMVESEDEVLIQKIVDDISSELFGNDEQ
ncbi:MAG: phosphoglucosamine mutase, partial [Pseudomonadota bacterium]|nr:phosphoglucosamine mutase [Pseudomonadota bacterium]